MQNEFAAKLHEGSRVGKVIGIVSGKGGVGKSLVTSLLAVAMHKRGYKVGILDGDITGHRFRKPSALLAKRPWMKWVCILLKARPVSR